MKNPFEGVDENELTDEVIVATLLGIVSKNHKFLDDAQKAIRGLVDSITVQTKELAKRANVPEPKIIAAPVDLRPLEVALVQNTKQMGDLAKAILASVSFKQPKTEWNFEVGRDLVGRIESIKAKPEKVKLN